MVLDLLSDLIFLQLFQNPNPMTHSRFFSIFSWVAFGELFEELFLANFLKVQGFLTHLQQLKIAQKLKLMLKILSKVKKENLVRLKVDHRLLRDNPRLSVSDPKHLYEQN